MRRLIHLSEREKLQLSEDSLMKVLLLNEFNLIHPSLDGLLKIANKNTAVKLIEIHNTLSDHSIKGVFLSTIEKISSRIGFQVINFEGNLKIK